MSDEKKKLTDEEYWTQVLGYKPKMIEMREPKRSAQSHLSPEYQKRLKRARDAQS